jgi:replicative DNA helicase
MNPEIALPESELAVIGSVIGLDLHSSEILDELNADVFTTEARKASWEIIGALRDTGESIGEVAFRSAWRKRFPKTVPPENLCSAMDNPVPEALLWAHKHSIEDASRRRSVLVQCRTTAARLSDFNTPIADCIENLQSVSDIRLPSAQRPASGLDLARGLQADLQSTFERQGAPTGIPTPWPNFNKMTGGLQLGEFSVIGARPSVGKTALGLNVARHAAMNLGVQTLIISLEMSAGALTRRMLCDAEGVPMSELRKGTFNQDDFVAFTKFTGALSKAPLRIVQLTGGADARRVCGIIRQDVRRHGTKLVLIDYLQKIRSSGRHEKRTYEVGEVSTALAGITKETNVAMLCLAQLNRESDKGDRCPRLSDLADSSQVERDGDLIGLLHRKVSPDDLEGEKTSLIIAKARDSETGLIPLSFDGRYQRFTARTTGA